MSANFKFNNSIGTFKFSKTDEAVHLRSQVEKFVVHNPITNVAWDNYCELRSLRETAKLIEDEEDAKAFDVIWDKFCNEVDKNGASKFGIALVVERSVLKVEPWA